MFGLRRHRIRHAPGAVPGTIISDPDALAPRLRVVAYGPGEVLEREIADVSEIKPLIGAHPVVWVNVDGLGDAGVIRSLGEMFSLHHLALEDVAHVNQRTKVEEYDDSLFLVCRMMTVENRELRSEQISMFLGKGFVVTFQERRGDCFDPIRERIRSGKGRIRGRGPDYLAYALLDALIDQYFPILEVYGERLEVLESEVAVNPDQQTLLRVRDVKGELQAIRHEVWPLRDAVNTLLRERFELITEDTLVYVRDCYDHAIRVIELVETFREQSSDLVNLYMSSVSNRMNEVMKVLTIIATIFIPLTFIAGIYGMNFDPEASPWNLPELGWYYGYPVALGAMLVCAIALLVFFRRKKWL